VPVDAAPLTGALPGNPILGDRRPADRPPAVRSHRSAHPARIVHGELAGRL